MTCINRTIVILTLLSLLIPGIGQVGQSQDRAGVSASEKTLIISGQTGVSGVIMRGLPGDPTTDNNAAYAARVRYGWGGIVTPTKEGFVFEPPNRNYTKATEDLANQDYVARLLTFTISGNAGASGVLMQGLPDTTVTDQNGTYTASVPYGWAGSVVPLKEGYTFEPVHKEYPRIVANVRNQDYKTRVQMLTISGTLRVGNEPIAHTRVMAEPGAYTAITDYQGRYTIQVPYGWSGQLAGMDFDDHRSFGSFTNVTNDFVDGRPVPSSRGQPTAVPSIPPAYPRAVLPSPAGNVFVIPTAQVMPDKIAETAEDLRIMLQILRDKLSEPRMIRGAFVNYGDFFGDRDRALEAFYLEGSAAVFVLEMDSPFAFAPVPPGTGEGPKEAVDPVWQRARERLASPQNPALRDPRGLPGATERMDFQQFQEDLLQTLRHAANLRNIEPNEAVIVTIIAHEESGAWPAPANAGGSYGAGGGGWFEGSSYSTSSSSFGPGGGSTYADSRTRSSGAMAGRGAPSRTGTGSVPAAPATVLTIQAKKADIDTFAKGGLTFEQFRQRVKTFTY